ncbi:hypothetical protein [Abyssalbus ytuae]|uniref:Uncharacterized protein n=1 Tax=Abyssalbus ytuae TaxID=2926907 RepID=A0A9E7CT95_9FLAO|nr:hypothetical protein [Abyssalbus ytuae]UOB17726.1 hypothetical protein MQE35_00160 [Abyssalbus ytuae]
MKKLKTLKNVKVLNKYEQKNVKGGNEPCPEDICKNWDILILEPSCYCPPN